MSGVQRRSSGSVEIAIPCRLETDTVRIRWVVRVVKLP